MEIGLAVAAFQWPRLQNQSDSLPDLQRVGSSAHLHHRNRARGVDAIGFSDETGEI
jgi:hypothetical protein